MNQLVITMDHKSHKKAETILAKKLKSGRQVYLK